MTAVLRFLPWMRRGLARAVSTAAIDGVPLTSASLVTAELTFDGEIVSREVRLRGPGDVIALSAAQIARTEPPDQTPDFEPNYFATVELVDPDLPWMFTPAAPSGDKLVPWLVLVVVTAGDGVVLARGVGATSVLTISNPADARHELPDLAESWAWAHVQAATEVSSSRPLAEAYAAEPEAFLARLVCPRRLAPATRYLACVVPAFEAGRLAGLGLPVPDDVAALAWSAETTEIELPAYHAWEFTTGPDGDFEALVRRLTPRIVDAGVHDLDIGSPGSTRIPAVAGTLVSYEGALLGPAITRREWDDAQRTAFAGALRELVDEGLAPVTAEPPRPYDPLRDDPIVALPAYGALPAGVSELPADGTWLADANLDPVARSAAGLGAEVVRRNQEALMAAAWEQAAAVRDINRVLNWTRLASETGARMVASKLAPLDDGALVQIAGTARSRISAAAGRTVRGQLADAGVPSGVTSAAFRRSVRGGGTLGRGLANQKARSGTAGRIATKFTTQLATAMEFAAYVRPLGVALGDSSIISGMPGVPATATATARLRARTSAPNTSVVVRDVVHVALPASSSSTLSEVAGAVRAGFAPAAVLGAKLRARITAPATAWGSAVVPASMSVEPVFPDPLAELLRRIDPELIMPGAGAIPDDTVGLVEVNARFVEAFLLGANLELSRELVWREYPADLAGTWLRTFWDSAGTAAEDIAPIADWVDGPLGSHQIGAGIGGTLVLLLKGALLRRYPETVIYAVRARWSSDRTQREEQPGGERRDPVLAGSLGRGVSYLGFELTEEAARGAVDAAGVPVPGGDAGWFFVFEQPPIGTRFGLDVGDAGDPGTMPHLWKNVSWGHQVDTASALDALTHARAGGRLAGTRRKYDEGMFQETWGAHAAAMARICFQRPVRMLVHASAMLP